MEIYINGMLIKRKMHANHINNLEEAFKLLQQFKMKENLPQVHFHDGGKFLSFVMTERGIEVDHRKIRAIKKLSSP